MSAVGGVVAAVEGAGVVGDAVEVVAGLGGLRAVVAVGAGKGCVDRDLRPLLRWENILVLN